MERNPECTDYSSGPENDIGLDRLAYWKSGDITRMTMLRKDILTCFLYMNDDSTKYGWYEEIEFPASEFKKLSKNHEKAFMLSVNCSAFFDYMNSVLQKQKSEDPYSCKKGYILKDDIPKTNV